MLVQINNGKWRYTNRLCGDDDFNILNINPTDAS